MHAYKRTIAALARDEWVSLSRRYPPMVPMPLMVRFTKVISVNSNRFLINESHIFFSRTAVKVIAGYSVITLVVPRYGCYYY